MILVNEQKVGLSRFPNGETLIDTTFLNELRYSREKCRINFKWCCNGDILILAFILKHLKELGIRKDLVIQYMPYSRMDRYENGNCFTLKHTVEIIKESLITGDSVFILEPHSDATLDLFFPYGYRVNIITPLMQKICRENKVDMICYPDAGAKARFQDDKVNLPVVFFNKIRDFDTGKITSLELEGESHHIAKKNVLILDDLCSRGGTFLHTANKLKEYGARDILLGVCHMETTIGNGVLLEETSPINHIYCFDTLFSGYDAERFSETTEKLTVYDTNHFLLEGEIKNV